MLYYGGHLEIQDGRQIPNSIGDRISRIFSIKTQVSHHLNIESLKALLSRVIGQKL